LFGAVAAAVKSVPRQVHDTIVQIVISSPRFFC
jgi:hypothetical protein